MSISVLRKQFDELRSELLEIDQAAAKALAGISGKGEAQIDLHRWKEQKERIKLELPIIESKLLQEEIEVLRGEREQAKRDLEKLQPQLQNAAAEYRERMKIMEEAYQKHARLSLQAYNLDQTLAQTFEDLSDKKGALKSLISSVTGVDDVKKPSDNVLIRN